MGMVSMKRMPNINFNYRDCCDIVYSQRFSMGGEAFICFSDKSNTLYKIFINPKTGEIIEMSDNKFKKIKSLYEKNLEHSVRPLATISVNGKLVGYEMTYDLMDIPLDQARLNRVQMIDALEDTKKVLLYFTSKDITYRDIKSNNILINRATGNISFCDMDNIRMGNYSMDLIGKDLKKYIQMHGGLDETAVAYMHNFLSLQQLGFPSKYTSYEGIILTLNNKVYPSDFDDKVRVILDSMTNPKEFTGEYAIQYVKK